ncbi:MAG TPA: excinuclease ABC subunit UvrC [Bacilli bacterium]|nr:excinuclease ABC subunit UvrC [Bacilli bacterium]
MKNKDLKFLVSNLPASPGVYLMQDKYGKIIYIGKAKNLKARVSQYFTRPQIGKVQAMVRNTVTFDLMLTETEKDALILELKLIQTHYPRYNVLLRDDSHYPYIALSKMGDPTVQITRDASKRELYHYFGPFPQSKSAYDIVTLVDRLFKTKKCKSKQKEPCFYYHLDLCLGYCFKIVPEDEKEAVRANVLAFLNGKDQTTLKHYETLVKKHSDELNYEKAQEYQNIVKSIQHILSDQKIELKRKQDLDVISFAQSDDLLSILIVNYRRGIRQAQVFETVTLFGEVTELLTTLLLQYYEKKMIPPQIIIGSSEVAHALSLVLETKLHVPKAGIYLELLNNAYVNATELLSKELLYRQIDLDAEKLLTKFSELLSINYPAQIDFVDIAHLAGSDAVGVVTTFKNGRPFKKLYRKYNIKTSKDSDDYQSLSEVLMRHYNRKLAEKNNIPDLLFVDGGLGHLNKALEVKEALSLAFPVFALVKNERHQTRALLNESGEEVVLPRELLHFLASMQEEVHRYAITTHQHKRKKGMYKTLLDDVKGLGPKRQRILLQTYKTLNAMQTATVEELAQLIPLEVAKALYEALSSVEL